MRSVLARTILATFVHAVSQACEGGVVAGDLLGMFFTMISPDAEYSGVW